MRYGYPLPERLDYFRSLFSDKNQNSISKYDVPIGGNFESLDVFRVPTELPKYRLDNTRTLHLQEQYIYKNNKPDDFFSDVESDAIQNIQHNLLKELIHNSDKDKDLVHYFSKTTQTEPLIITNDGFVISGNRRLCAYRELLEIDYEKYNKFALIRVVILPKLSSEQIDQIEDYLEQQKDIKEPFNWISRAIGYNKRMIKYNYSDEKLARITKMKKSEIRGLIDKLEIADRYLESIEKPKDYDQILNDEFAFNKIYSCLLKDKSSPAKKTAFEKFAFLAIKNKDTFADRMYKNIPIIYQAQDLIENEISEVFEEEITLIQKEIGKESTPLDLFNESDPVIPIIKLVENSENETKILDIINDKVDECILLEKEKKKKNSVLDRVRKAHTLMIEANQIISHETDKNGVLVQLDYIIKEIDKLKLWLSNHANS